MKKFKATKLILSGVALAATAATLSSTTYAWYISNVTATAAASGSTAGASGDGSVYISKDNNTYTSSVEFTNAGDYTKHGELIPLTSTDGTSFVNDAGTANTANYIQYTVYIKADKDCRITPKLVLTNTTTTMKTQTAYHNIIKDTAVGDGKTYAAQPTEFSVDAANALRMAVSTYDSPSATSPSATKIYDVRSIAQKWTSSQKTTTEAYTNKANTVAESDLASFNFTNYLGTYKAPESAPTSSTFNSGKYYTAAKTADTDYISTKTYYTVSSGRYSPVGDASTGFDENKANYYEITLATSFSNEASYLAEQTTSETLNGAHGYYKAVMGDAPTHTEDDLKSEGTNIALTAWDAFDLNENTATKLTFTFWLEGADISCFDSCVSQDFDFELCFTAGARSHS